MLKLGKFDAFFRHKKKMIKNGRWENEKRWKFYAAVPLMTKKRCQFTKIQFYFYIM